MKRFFNWQVGMALVLLALSAFFYELHYLLFRDARHIVIYLIGDIAFVFIEVLLVTLVLHRLLALREKKALLKKMNMVIGAFFSEVGTDLIRRFRSFDAGRSDMSEHLIVTKNWTGKHFIRTRKLMAGYACEIDCSKGDLNSLKEFLKDKRQFLLGLLENPNLLEHESFTDLLWAVFHLTEELAGRTDLDRLPRSDYDHISGDIKRAYGHLITEWLTYMTHLQSGYPYLFSLAVRTNPFDPKASVVVK